MNSKLALGACEKMLSAMWYGRKDAIDSAATFVRWLPAFRSVALAPANDRAKQQGKRS